MMNKGEKLYSGKVKSVYATEDPRYVIMEFRDDATAFNAQKHAQLADKGRVNNQFNNHIMDVLQKGGVETHIVEHLSPNTVLVKHLEMMPVECVIRNYAAGSICKRYGFDEGMAFEPPLFELFLKSDELGDPLIPASHAVQFGYASEADLSEMERLSRQVNDILLPLFEAADLMLVDFKLEFGRFDGQLVLGDEFTPDGCRIWHRETREIFDKDRFRKDLGDVIEGYKSVAEKLGIEIK